MQEEVENRTLTLTVNATKFTGRVLKAALSKYLAHRKNKKLQNSRDSPDGVKPYGRVSMEDLKKANVDRIMGYEEEKQTEKDRTKER